MLLTGLEGRAEDSEKQAAVDAPGKPALPVPRFVSLKSDKVNVRKGPSTDQSIVWVFSRAGLPVEIIAEFGQLAARARQRRGRRLGVPQPAQRAPHRAGDALVEGR